MNDVLTKAKFSPAEKWVTSLLFEAAGLDPSGSVISAWRVLELAHTADLSPNVICRAKAKLRNTGLGDLLRPAEPRLRLPDIWTLDGLNLALNAAERSNVR